MLNVLRTLFQLFSAQEHVQQHKKFYRNEGCMDQRLLTATGKVWRFGQGRKIVSSVVVTTCLLFFRKCAGIMALSKHVTHNGPQSGFPYYNLTMPNRQSCPFLLPGNGLSNSVGLSPGNLHQNPVQNQQPTLYVKNQTYMYKSSTGEFLSDSSPKNPLQYAFMLLLLHNKHKWT